MARQLISMLEGEFDPAEFRDEYNDRVIEFLRAKAKGKRPKLARIETRRESRSLEQDLARSVESVRKSAAGSRKRHGKGSERTEEAA
jgi:non-homologous end joining protein Ku